MKHRFPICTLLTALLLASALLSCGDSEQTEAQTQTAEGSAQTTEASATEDLTFSGQLAKNAQDFGGREIRISTNNELNGNLLPTTIQFATEETGEIVNDTLLAREIWVEETYNVQITHTDLGYFTWAGTEYAAAIQAGDLPYEFFIDDLASRCAFLAPSGYLYPLNMVDTIRLDREYWFPHLNGDLLINGDLYFAACPISPRYYGSVYVIMFNRDLAATLDLPDFYDSVKNGTWTIDQMTECAKAALRDVDGNSKWDENDIYGMTYEVLTPEAMVLGAGYHTM